MNCLRDRKRCYIHHDEETGFELRCRYYDLVGYGGECPEVQKKNEAFVGSKV